jgi:hypothetical protein
MVKKIWIVVHVWRGLVQEPEVFSDEKSAKKRKKEISRRLNPDYDECGLFEKRIIIPLTL